MIIDMYGQKIMPESGLYYYSDDCHTTEIEFFPGNTLCIMNTTCDIAMFQAACGTYYWKEDTLFFENDANKFLETHLHVDTLGCKRGEILIHLKTIAPLDEPEWRNIFMPSNLFSTKSEDSLQLGLIQWPDLYKSLSWSQVAAFDTFNLGRLGIIMGPSILIRDALCMNVEYPVLWLMAIEHPRMNNQFVFSNISKKRAKITAIHNSHSYTRKFKYLLGDPFGQ